MEIDEEKIEILVAWFNGLRLSELKNSSSFEEFVYGQQGNSVRNAFPMVCTSRERDSFHPIPDSRVL